MSAIFMAFAAAYVGLALTPRIIELHRNGVRRDETAEGRVLESIHRRAESTGKAGLFCAVAFVGLSIFTLRVRRPDEEDEDEVGEVFAPLPPGPRDD